MKAIYGIFGFDFHLELSTRPDNYLGDLETWNAAEAVRPFDSISDVRQVLIGCNSNLPALWINSILENGNSIQVMVLSMDPKSTSLSVML